MCKQSWSVTAAFVSNDKIEVFWVKEAFPTYCPTQQPARRHRAPLAHPSELSDTEIRGHCQKLLRTLHQLLPDTIS